MQQLTEYIKAGRAEESHEAINVTYFTLQTGAKQSEVCVIRVHTSTCIIMLLAKAHIFVVNDIMLIFIKAMCTYKTVPAIPEWPLETWTGAQYSIHTPMIGD